jgi:hypothetical protein
MIGQCAATLFALDAIHRADDVHEKPSSAKH